MTRLPSPPWSISSRKRLRNRLPGKVPAERGYLPNRVLAGRCRRIVLAGGAEKDFREVFSRDGSNT